MAAKWALKGLWNFCSHDRGSLRNVVNTQASGLESTGAWMLGWITLKDIS